MKCSEKCTETENSYYSLKIIRLTSEYYRDCFMDSLKPCNKNSCINMNNDV